MRIVIKTQAQARVHLGTFGPGRLPEHGRQRAQFLDQFADLCGRHDARSLRLLKAGLPLVAFRGAATQCSGQVLNGHTTLHGGNQSSNLGIRLAKLALQGGVASTGCRVHVLPACEVFRIRQGGYPFVKSHSHKRSFWLSVLFTCIYIVHRKRDECRSSKS